MTLVVASCCSLFISSLSLSLSLSVIFAGRLLLFLGYLWIASYYFLSSSKIEKSTIHFEVICCSLTIINVIIVFSVFIAFGCLLLITYRCFLYLSLFSLSPRTFAAIVFLCFLLDHINFLPLFDLMSRQSMSSKEQTHNYWALLRLSITSLSFSTNLVWCRIVQMRFFWEGTHRVLFLSNCHQLKLENTFIDSEYSQVNKLT